VSNRGPLGILLTLLTLPTGVTALGALAGCATAGPPYDYASEPDPRKAEYVLGPSDVLRITVWRNPDLSGDTTVRPDGTITMPLIGDLRAAGRTPSQVRAEIADRLKTFLRDEAATVTLAVSAINSYRFTVSGNVEHPGSFASNHYVTFSEALTLAGGPNRFASPERCVLVRADPAGAAPKRIPINYTAILAGKRPDMDLPLLAGDLIVVP
jgi:polysaccharide export outer membrane protein